MKKKLKGLSEREKEVLKLVADGFSNKEIAEMLCISENTIKAHVTSIIIKLKTRNRVSAAVSAVRNNVIK